MSSEGWKTATGLETWLARHPAGTPSLPALVEPLRTRRTPLELFHAIVHHIALQLIDAWREYSSATRQSQAIALVRV